MNGNHCISRILRVLLVLTAPLAAAAASAQETGAIEEILVTAQKRAQSIQDVHISMNAFDAEDMRDFGWTDITQVANQSPNLDIKYTWGNSMPVYTIRGVGMQSFQASDTPSVGLFVDEVFQTSIAIMGAQLFDIERVEVIKGPQGDLFGRNTNGGAVSYFTRQPSQERDASIRLDYGRWNRAEAEAAFGGPLSDTVSGRVSLMSIQQTDGWVHNRTTGNDVGEVDILAGRVQLLWAPADDFSANFKIFASRDRSQPVYFQHVGYRDKANPFGGVCQAFLENRLDPRTCVDYGGYSDTDGDPFAGDYTHDKSTAINEDETLRNDNIGVTLTLEKGFGDLDLLSVTSYQEYDRWQPKESDATPALYVDFLFTSQIWAFSQEFRLTSGHEGPFNWILGANYSRDEVAELPGRVGYLDHFPPSPGRAELTYEQDRENLAAYGQVNWDLAEQWRLSAGGRVVRDDVTFTQAVSFDLPSFGLTLSNMLPRTIIDADGNEVELDGKYDDTAFTWRVALDFLPSDDLLLYASAATGIKPGGFNGGLNLNPSQYRPFDKEEVTAYELGLKSTFADGRAVFNAAAFTYDYEGLQAVTVFRDDQRNLTTTGLTNLAAADVKGLEAELQWRPIDNLDIKLGLALLDTKNNDERDNFKGPLGDSPRKLANSPEQSFNASLGYDIPLQNGAKVRLFGDYYYQGDHFKQIININTQEISQDMLNARITYTSADGNWDIGVWGRNLTDELWVTDTLDDPGRLGATGPLGLGWGVWVYAPPRSYGISFNWRWEQ